VNAYQGRLCRLREALADLSRALLVTNLVNVRYLCGFTGSSGSLLVTDQEAVLITDSRYRLQAQQEAPDCRLQVAPRQLEGIVEVVRGLGLAGLAFERAHLTCALYEDLSARLPEVTLIATSELVEGLRMIKEAQEIRAIGQAAALTDAAFQHLCGLLRPGLTERQLGLEAEFYMRRQGADSAAFEPIIAAGPRSALPHARPSPRPLQPGDLVVVDLGARLDGYCSDLTRTVALSRAGDQEREIYQLCLWAQAAGLEALVPGAACRDVDAAARQVIASAGYGDCFGHGLGHSLGLETHEMPRLSPLDEHSLAPGMVLTVEPGIYLPERGGVRIEDLAEITASGCRLLSRAPKPAELPVLT